MPNLIQLAEQLKGAPDQFLQQESQTPSGYAPPYLILGEISRREQLRKQASAGPPPSTTVQQDLMRAAAPPMPPQGMPPGMMPPGMMPPQGLPQQPPSQGLGAILRNAPVRMAGGSLVRGTYPMLPTPNWMYNSAFAMPSSAPRTQEEIDEERRKKMYSTPEGVVIGGVLFKNLPDAPAFEARPAEPIRVEEPAIEPLLERVRAMRETPTSGFESRIAELEQERKKIRQPGLGDFLIQSGLGGLASRAPFASQAFGESALNAYKDISARRDVADEQRRGIAAQIASARLQQEEERRRSEQQNLNLASAMQQRLHGQAVTEAQAKMQYAGQVEAARRAAYEQQLEQQRAQHRYDTQLKTAWLGQMDKVSPFDPRYREQKVFEAGLQRENQLAVEKARHQGDMQEIYARVGAAQGAQNKYEATLSKAANLNNAVQAMVDTEVRKPYHDFSKTPNQVLEESKHYIAQNLMDPQYFKDIPITRRQLLRDRVLAWNPTKDYKDTLEEHFADWATQAKENPNKAKQSREQWMKGAAPIPNLNEAAGGEEGTLRYLSPRAEGGAAALAAGPTVGSSGKIIMDENYVTGYKPGQDDKKTAPARPSVGLAASPHLQTGPSVSWDKVQSQMRGPAQPWQLAPNPSFLDEVTHKAIPLPGDTSALTGTDFDPFVMMAPSLPSAAMGPAAPSTVPRPWTPPAPSSAPVAAAARRVNNDPMRQQPGESNEQYLERMRRIYARQRPTAGIMGAIP